MVVEDCGRGLGTLAKGDVLRIASCLKTRLEGQTNSISFLLVFRTVLILDIETYQSEPGPQTWLVGPV